MSYYSQKGSYNKSTKSLNNSSVFKILNYNEIEFDIDKIDKMDGFKFERLLATYFYCLGYDYEKTPDRDDFGADLILTKNNERIAVQAKRWNSYVDIKAVQEVVAAKGYYSAQKAWVVTNNYFTDPAKELANRNGVKLIDRPRLKKILYSVQNDANNKLIQALQKYYTKKGFTVKPTKRAANFGADLILEKNGERTVLRAKRSTDSVDITPVQEVAAAKGYYGASHAVIVTNNFYKNATTALAFANKITLIDRKGLIKIFEELKENEKG